MPSKTTDPRTVSPALRPTAVPQPSPPTRAAPDPATEPPHRNGARRKTQSVPGKLAREVARLEAELAAMAARVAELEAHAERDPLTGLLNRRGFAGELARAVSHVQRYGGRLVLVYLDLDDFKPINDAFGHAAGDAVLQAVAATLTAAVRVSDAVARLGGDEFAVLLWNLSDADAAAKAERLERRITETTVSWEGSTLAVGASAGIAPLDDGDPAAALAAADAAMYRRKRTRHGHGGTPATPAAEPF